MSYRLIYTNMRIASTCISILDTLFLLCICLHFVTTPAPVEYTKVSYGTIDLGNYIPRDKSWDATELQSPHRHLLKDEEYQSGSDPLVQADTLAVDVEVKEASMDRFVNYIITINIDEPSWLDYAKNAALLVIHTIFRPLQYS